MQPRDEPYTDGTGEPDHRPHLGGSLAALAAGALFGGAVAVAALALTPGHQADHPTAHSTPAPDSGIVATVTALTCHPTPASSPRVPPPDLAPSLTCRVRLSLTNPGPRTLHWSLAAQRLQRPDAVTTTPDLSLATAHRQPDHLTLNPGMRIDFDLYATLPNGAAPTALICRDDDGDPALTVPLPTAT